MAALLIGAEEKVQIKNLKDFAEANVIGHEELMRMTNGFGEPIGDNPNFVAEFPIGFRVVFSYEMQKTRKTKHISITHKGRLPPIPAVNMLLEEFGFLHKVEDLKNSAEQTAFIWIEEEINAVNVIEFAGD
jgi:hypothetical protein